MLAASALAAARGVFPEADRAALAAHIMQMGPLPPVGDLSAAEVTEATRRDKKVLAGPAALRAADDDRRDDDGHGCHARRTDARRWWRSG